jgi:signal transduction histidine kinase
VDVAQSALPAARRNGVHRALVHDIGKLFLLRRARRHGARARIRRLAELIREMLDNAHAEVGYRLLVSWHLPEVFQTIVRDHRGSARSGQHPAPDRAAGQPRLQQGGHRLRPQPIWCSARCAEAATGMSEIAIAELEIILEDVMAQSVAAAFALG